jgi:hypothetical protein
MKNFTANVINKLKIFFCALGVLMLFYSHCEAQYGGCVDTTTIIPGNVCDTNNVLNGYNPVCGCDGNTYFNYCVAQSLHGVSTWQDGVCQTTGVDFVLYPNPVNYGTINMILGVFDINDNIHVTIYSVANFQFCYEKYFTLADVTAKNYYEFPIIPEVSTYPRGVYIIIAQSSEGSQHAVHKFVVMPMTK